MTQRSGVLEWCENTLPISLILLGDGKKPGIHKKYYPNDYDTHKCRKMLEVSFEVVLCSFDHIFFILIFALILFHDF